MPLPPTRYLDAGPGTPQASPNVAAAQASAYANLGQTIAAVGERGMQLAAHLKGIEDTGALAGLYARMEKDASDFSIGLMTREDTSNWPQEWQKRAETWRQEAKKQKLSPSAMAQFEEKFLDWNTRRSIQFETQAATKGIEIARGKVANAYQFHLDNQNYDAARETLRLAHQGGLTDSVSLEKGLMEIDKTQRHDGVMADIEDDPTGWIDQHQKPLPGYDMTSWNRLRAHARSVERERTYAVAENVQDGIVSGKIATPEQVDEVAAGLRPTERENLKTFLTKWNQTAAENLQNDPNHQAQVLGEFNRKLSEYVPVAGDAEDMPAVELGGLTKMVPAGPLRDDMERRIQAVKANQKAEAQSNLDLMLEQVTAAAKSGKLGSVPSTEVSTEQRVKGGFLRNEQTLTDLGFNEDQRAKFKEAKSDSERQQLLQDMWTQRGQAKKDIDPLTWRTAEAIRNGLPKFDMDPQAKDSAQAALDLKVGTIEIGMKEWARLNPEAARDPEKIREELHKRTGVEIRKPVRRIASAPGKPPTETSMNTPKDGIKLSNYGYASDTTPDSNSAQGIGHRDNKLIPGESAAISKSLADRLGLTHGDKIKIDTTKGSFSVYYHDTVPSYDKRTGPLPETIDIYRPKDGSNSWGGRVLNISKIS